MPGVPWVLIWPLGLPHIPACVPALLLCNTSYLKVWLLLKREEKWESVSVKSKHHWAWPWIWGEGEGNCICAKRHFGSPWSPPFSVAHCGYSHRNTTNTPSGTCLGVESRQRIGSWRALREPLRCPLALQMMFSSEEIKWLSKTLHRIRVRTRKLRLLPASQLFSEHPRVLFWFLTNQEPFIQADNGSFLKASFPLSPLLLLWVGSKTKSFISPVLRQSNCVVENRVSSKGWKWCHPPGPPTVRQ